MVLGDDFTYRALRLDGGDIVFEQVAPLEPDRRPTHGSRISAERPRRDQTPGAWCRPRWATPGRPTTSPKIDHIVVVMMENRSFDHVLG